MSTPPTYPSMYHDPELFDWLLGVQLHSPRWPGRFLKSIASAARYAGEREYNLMRPMLLELKVLEPDFCRPKIATNSSKPA